MGIIFIGIEIKSCCTIKAVWYGIIFFRSKLADIQFGYFLSRFFSIEIISV